MTQIEFIEQIYPALSDSDKAEAEKIWPELGKSEDERIRKRLIDCLKFSLKGAEEQDAAGCSRQKDIEAYKWGISYLEKPKEQKPIAESKRLANEVIEYLRKCGYSLVLKDDSKKEYFHIDIPRHEDDFWQSEEYKHCRSVLGEYYMEGDYGCDTYTLYVWREKKEQKPVEWSEEDEEILDATVDMVSNSLYEPLCPRDKMLTWLKSLRPQPPHWKPSEEQMLTLCCACRKVTEQEAECLDSLYNDLKELM